MFFSPVHALCVSYSWSGSVIMICGSNTSADWLAHLKINSLMNFFNTTEDFMVKMLCEHCFTLISSFDPVYFWSLAQRSFSTLRFRIDATFMPDRKTVPTSSECQPSTTSSIRDGSWLSTFSQLYKLHSVGEGVNDWCTLFNMKKTLNVFW